MPIQSLFPTQIYSAHLPTSGWRKFNDRLRRECQQLRQDDVGGQRWSKKNYPGGYTSYNSACRMHLLSPTFALLERKLNRHVQAYARGLELDLEGRELTMTDCWVNIMPRGTVHTLHLHPHSSLSGTYYVQSVTHTINGDGYSQRFSLKRNALGLTKTEGYAAITAQSS